jgi:hypothetical protein
MSDRTELAGEGLLRAIDGELARATAESAELQRKGRRTKEEADYISALLTDIRADLAFGFGPDSSGRGFSRSDPAMSWQNKVRWIRGELEDRRANYPELVAKGRMTKQAAELGIRTVKALARLYWRDMFMWEPEPGPALDYIRAVGTGQFVPGSDARHQLWLSPGGKAYRDAAWAQLQLSRPPEQGELLAA